MSEAYYRANLEACWRMAAKTPHELERRAWLDLAASWRLLIITEGRCSTGEDDFDADERSPPSGHRVITNVRRWLARQAGRYISEYRSISEKATSLVDLFLDPIDHQRAPSARAAPRRRFRAPILGNTLANAARRTLERRRARAS